MTTVYRIEHKLHKFGPLCCKCPGNEYLNWYRYFKDHRPPLCFPEFSDFVGKLSGWSDDGHPDYVFGMKSLDDLFSIIRWENDLFHELESHGFELMSFAIDTLDSVTLPDGQVMFNRSTAKRIA